MKNKQQKEIDFFIQNEMRMQELKRVLILKSFVMSVRNMKRK
jgi:hypothetical protein